MDYMQSHPWLTFQLRLEVLDACTWMLLGEAESKIEHIAGAPLPPAVAAKLHSVYLTKGVHATTQIEGNTLTEDDVRLRVNHQLKLPRSQEYLGQEIDNIVDACNLIVDDIAAGRSLKLTPERICEFNQLVLRDLPPEEGVIPGKIREDSVLVGQGVYKGAPAGNCEYLLVRLCDWIEEMRKNAPSDLATPVAILSAVMAHLYLAWIHPFGNGNGRTARLVEFQLLAKAGAPTPSAHLLSDHYNKTRTRYYQVLADTSRPPYPILSFIKYAMEGFVDGLREQISEIRTNQLWLIWVNFVHEVLHQEAGDHMSHTAIRQRALVFALPVGEMTQLSDIPELTPKLAHLYAQLTHRAVSRDVNKLAGLGLVIKEEQGRTVRVRPNIEQLEGFLPMRANHE
jgi:Fic family protein